jgi:hypothetical protein
MTVPDPLSLSCELRRCHSCDGTALDYLREKPSRCTCSCHTTRRSR